MVNLIDLGTFTDDGNIQVVVEMPKGARIKAKYDPTIAAFCYVRPLAAGLAYPYDWGFVPGTRGADGDPLDAMIFHAAATFPGMVIACRLLGVLQVEQTQDSKTLRNDRFLFCPAKDPALVGLQAASDLPERTRRDMEHFFVSATLDTGKELTVLGWEDADTAITGLAAGMRAFEPARKD